MSSLKILQVAVLLGAATSACANPVIQSQVQTQARIQRQTSSLTACKVLNSNGTATSPKQDAHFLILSQAQSCPQDVVAYKNILLSQGLSSKPSMVANRGRNNPSHGSFSFFEQVTGALPTQSASATQGRMKIFSGEFFYGHFTAKQNNQIVLDQTQNKGQLLIELIAWDYSKKLFNFYELIGTGGAAQWFYRGDSQDILNDNKFLYRASSPQFGRTLRCSACHSSGGPIMKELAAPHNDWWTKERPLSFGNATASSQVKNWMQDLQMASSFSLSVQQGIQKLLLSPRYQQIKSSLSLQEQLRPLFCDTEVNLISSAATSDTMGGNFPISTAAFLNPFFGLTQITFSKAQYGGLMSKYGLRFPENGQRDADHLWLAPVKGYSDLLAIQILIKKGTVDTEFVYDVLAVDGKKSLFSKERCDLLKLVPNSFGGSWKSQFINNLKASSSKAAATLVKNLTDPVRTKNWYIALSQKYFSQILKQGLNEDLFVRLLQDRVEVFESEISKNPLGQILEPGFRVIFPVPR